MPVFRFVRDLLGRNEEQSGPIVVDIAALPGLIDEEATGVRARVDPALEAPAREVHRAVGDLNALLERLAGADWDTAHHPKLEQISRTTLPAFVRAMESCLARPLPDDPHEFYGAATAVLRCSISALRGQGRYLRAVLPDEMKAVKAAVDVIGHAVNAMTAALGEEKRELAALDGLRNRLDRIAALAAEEQDAVRRSADAGSELAIAAGERAETQAELDALNRSPAALELEERQAEAARLRARAGSLEAAHRVQAEALVQLLRRAERLVAKRGDRQTATRLHHLQSALSQPLSGHDATLVTAIAGGLAVVRDLVAAGEIASKEGDPLLDDPTSVAAAVGARVEDHGMVVDRAGALERELAASPAAQDRERLAGRLRQLDHRAVVLEDERAGLARVAEQKAKERATMLAELEKEVGAVFAGRVRLAPGDA